MADAPDVAPLSHALDDMIADYGPGLFGVVSRGGHIIFAGGAGTAELGKSRAITIDDEFRVASLTKMYVAAITLQLIEEGACRLDNSIALLLPEVVPDGEAITLEQLLTMHSGLPDYLPTLLGDPPDVALYDRYYSPQDLLQRSIYSNGRCVPGSSFEYSSTNYILLGLVIERLTKEPLETALWRRIITPLSLRRTRFPTIDRYLRGQHSRGYARMTDAAGYIDVTATQQSAAWAAGAIVSTPVEIIRFLDSLASGELLSEAMWQKMRTTTQLEPGFGYGMGLQSYEFSSGAVTYGHTGNAPGFQCIALRSTDGQSVVLYRNAADLVRPLPSPPDIPFIVAALEV